jgi:CubicO group peptidase (beta-lactamase class C family)
LTKPLVTQACLLTLAAQGKLALEQPVAELLPDFAGGADARRREVTVAMLLAHRSGLPARSLYFERIGLAAPDESDPAMMGRTPAVRIAGWAATEPLVAAPGSVSVYSDVGFIILGAVVEAVGGAALNEVFEREFAAVMSSQQGGFRPLGRLPDKAAIAQDSIAPTGYCNWRGRTVCGEVQDENAWAMGGVAGHAGLFATAEDVHRLTLEYVLAHSGADARLEARLVRTCWNGPFAEDSTWALGWDTPTPGASSAGPRISRRSFGHLGFTGSSVWVDLDRGLQVILLSNRVHPDPANVAIRDFRPRLHDAVFEAFDKAVGSGSERGVRK